MLELHALGTVGIRDDRRGPLAASPKPLALLVYLAVARPRGPQPRDSLLALFYPELDTDHARSSLRQLVRALRDVVGDAVRSDRQTVGLDTGSIRCDVLAFEAALDAGDPAKAVAAYRGPFLQGFFLSGSPEFEEWVESERSRLRRAYEGALERLALETDAAGEAVEAVGWWRQLAEADPLATRVTVRLMAALEVAGDRAAALEVADRHAERLKEELDAEPSPEVEALARRLRAQPVAHAPEPQASTRERLASAVAGRYRVTGVAGAGGMALVYRAEDLKLGRPVALKVLRPELAAAIGHERFLNEVDIAAGLSHPNILPVHDVGAADGLLYYVMPYVAGESLRARLAREGPLEPAEAVRIAREVAGALAYAHGRGIIHRDVKPANILLLEDHAVVSDFGVARAVGKILDDPELAGLTGTPAYMSPEQIAGSPEIDARTDLYSLGCVLYEMLTGAPPDLDTDPEAVFSERPSPADTATSRVRGSVPAPVVATLSGALAQDPVQRFRTAEEFVAALSAEVASRPASGRKRVRPSLAAVAATVLLAVGALVVRELTRRFTVTAGIPQHAQMDAGIDLAPAISPDGTELAYVADGALFVQSLSGGSPLHLADGAAGVSHWSPDGDRIFFGGWTGTGSMFAFKEVDRAGGPVRILDRAECYNPTLSPDGTRVACWWNPEGPGFGIFIWSVGGGTKLVEPVAIVPETGEIHTLSWSPDGRRLAWVRSPNRGDPQFTRALIANELVTSAIWVWREGGEPTQITDGEHRDMIPAWLPDNRHLLFVSDRDGPRDLYVLDADAPGEPQRVTFGENPGHLSLSADGRRLVYAKTTLRRNIWSLPIPEHDAVSIVEGRPVTAARSNERVLWHDLSPDGDSIAFDFRRDPGGMPHVYRMALEGGVPVQLTADAYGGYHPVWSPDGREIAFARDAEDLVELWVMDADGGNQRREVEALGGWQYFDWSGDGLQLIYERGSAGLWAVSRDSLRQGYDMPVEFGEPAPWYDGECQLPRRVRGGSGIVCNAFFEQSRIEPFSRLTWLSADGQVAKRYDPTPFAVADPRFRSAVLRRDFADLDILWWTRYPRYSPDGSTLYFFGNPGGQVFVMSMPAAGGDVRRVVGIDDGSIMPWTPKNDGRGPGALTIGKDAIYLSVGEWDSDIRVVDLEW
jgi:Tol biopolymer transport system component/DNA-binding SARP family transcriptional activator